MEHRGSYDHPLPHGLCSGGQEGDYHEAVTGPNGATSQCDSSHVGASGATMKDEGYFLILGVILSVSIYCFYQEWEGLGVLGILSAVIWFILGSEQ